jgi:hypothetical protein
MLLNLQETSSSRSDILLVFLPIKGYRRQLGTGCAILVALAFQAGNIFWDSAGNGTFFSQWTREVATTAAGNRPKVSFTTTFQSVYTSPDSLPCLKQPQVRLEIGGPNETVTSCDLLAFCDIRRYRKWIVRSPGQPFGMHNEI